MDNDDAPDENVPDWGIELVYDAKAFVQRGLKEATPEEKERILREFAGIRSKNIKKSRTTTKKQSKKTEGGAQTTTEFYDFMQLVDTCHDFADDEEDLETILEVMGDIRVPCKFDKILLLNSNEKLLVEYLTTCRQFRFGDAAIPNPLYKADILHKTGMEPNDTFEDLFNRQQNVYRGKYGSDVPLLPVEVMTENSEAPRRLLQIAELCRIIREKFGEDCRFCLDCANNQMVNVITSIQNVSDELYKAVFPGVSVEDVSAGLKAAIQRVHADGTLLPTIWKAEVTDANMFDAATTSRTLDVDVSPTGNIYQRGVSGRDYLQIRLDGIEKKNGNQKYVKVTFTDSDGISLTSEFTSKESPKYFSLNVIRSFIGLNVFSKPSKQHELMNFSDHMKYAMKRAGDWGQVEHCVKYSKVFVTADKFAALYAYYRGVRFIFMREAHHRKLAAYPKLPDSFQRHVFIIGHKRV